MDNFHKKYGVDRCVLKWIDQQDPLGRSPLGTNECSSSNARLLEQYVRRSSVCDSSALCLASTARKAEGGRGIH